MAVAGPEPCIVGALSCQKNSYLRSLETEVVSCNEFIPPKVPQTNTKSKIKKSTDASQALENEAISISKTWLIEFADSVLFPEGTSVSQASRSHLTPIQAEANRQTTAP